MRASGSSPLKPIEHAQKHACPFDLPSPMQAHPSLGGVCLSPPACLPACLSVCLSVCLCVRLPTCLSVSICFQVCLRACLSACLSRASLSFSSIRLSHLSPLFPPQSALRKEEEGRGSRGGREKIERTKKTPHSKVKRGEERSTRRGLQKKSKGNLYEEECGVRGGWTDVKLWRLDVWPKGRGEGKTYDPVGDVKRRGCIVCLCSYVGV
mmetsp:Transcript_39527/g.77790  ORF Transcript_39527/g.77790 Transcript_39527/m.77790 type:complete len:209 (-) Transcript_39527:2579-3205(-)